MVYSERKRKISAHNTLTLKVVETRPLEEKRETSNATTHSSKCKIKVSNLTNRLKLNLKTKPKYVLLVGQYHNLFKNSKESYPHIQTNLRYDPQAVPGS
jgi:hypothetical protein